MEAGFLAGLRTPELLARQRASATFFVLGWVAERRPAATVDILAPMKRGR